MNIDFESESATGIIVASLGAGPGPALARAWATRHPGRVALLSDQLSPADAALYSPATRWDSRESIAQAFAAAADRLGPIGHVLLSAVPFAALAPLAFESLPEPAWKAASHDAVKAMLFGLLAARTLMPAGGAITLLGPNLGLTGAARLAPLCMALEAQRALGKSAARQWGARGLRVNWVAVSPQAFDVPASVVPAVPELGPPPPALNRDITPEDDLAPLLRVLGSRPGRAMTGQTLNLDGGNWMLP